MPVIDNELVGYIGGAYVYMDSDGIFSAESTFVPDWRVDEDPRKVAGYVVCQSEAYADRNNDVYLADIDVRYSTGKGDRVSLGNTYRSEPVEPTYTPSPGYDVLTTGDKPKVRCWYCDTEFDYALSTRWTREQFVAEMLIHYSEHRSNSDLPYVRTYIKVGVRRPDGSVVAIPEHARKVTKPWLVKGALL